MAVPHATPRRQVGARDVGAAPVVGWNERRRHLLTIATLPRETFDRAGEPESADGTLTERLAARCTQVEAFDPAPDRVRRARDRLARARGVKVHRGALATFWPWGGCDLVVLTDVLHRLDDATTGLVLAQVRASLRRGGAVVAAHWREPPVDAVTAEEAHARVGATDFLHHRTHLRDDDFVLDVWTRS